MSKPKRTSANRYLWTAGGAGFAIALLASLAGGNLFITSMKRAVIGFIVTFTAFWIARLLLSLNDRNDTANVQKLEVNEDSVAGNRFDVTLPAEPLETPPAAGDFQPWVAGGEQHSEEQRIQEMVQAVRTIQD